MPQTPSDWFQGLRPWQVQGGALILLPCVPRAGNGHEVSTLSFTRFRAEPLVVCLDIYKICYIKTHSDFSCITNTLTVTPTIAAPPAAAIHTTTNRSSSGRHDRGGRSGLGRFFARGDLRLVILDLIAEKPRHGYEIIKAIEEHVVAPTAPALA